MGEFHPTTVVIIIVLVLLALYVVADKAMRWLDRRQRHRVRRPSKERD